MSASFVFPQTQELMRIQSPILLAAPQATIVLNVSYVGFLDLWVRLWARTTGAAFTQVVRALFNGSSNAADYKNVLHRLGDTTVAVVLNNGASGFSDIGDAVAANGIANALSLIDFKVFNAFSTSKGKSYKAEGGSIGNVTAGNTSKTLANGLFVPTGALSTITFALAGADNFAAGTYLDAFYISRG